MKCLLRIIFSLVVMSTLTCFLISLKVLHFPVINNQVLSSCETYAREPKFKVGNVKDNRYIAVTIPSIARAKANYLTKTLSGLVNNLNVTLRSKTIFIVYLADKNDTLFYFNANKLQQHFSKEVKEGLIEIISPPVELRPNWKNELFNNFGDSALRNQWRSKQNLDMEYLMTYVMRHINFTYFLMMEDDVDPVEKYMDIILKFAEEKPASEWEYCSFTSVGGSGKLFHRASLARYASLIKTFWNTKPLDWLMWDLVRLRYCGYDGSLAKCIERSNQDIRIYPQTLFVHTGKQTSRSDE